MVKRFFHRFSLRPWADSLAVYGQGRLWQEVWHQAQRSRWAEAAAAVAFFWLLGWLGGGFVALHLGQGAGRWLPPGILGLARSLQMGLAIADADPKAQILGRWAVGLIGLGAWLCLVTGTQRRGTRRYPRASPRPTHPRATTQRPRRSSHRAGLGATQAPSWPTRLNTRAATPRPSSVSPQGNSRVRQSGGRAGLP